MRTLAVFSKMHSFTIALPVAGVSFEALLSCIAIAAVVLTILLGRLRLEPRRLLGWCTLSFVLASLAGVAVALCAVVFGEVHPLDRWHLVSGIIIVGAVAGAIVAVLMGIIGTIQIRRQNRPCQCGHGGKEELPPGSSTPEDVVD